MRFLTRAWASGDLDDDEWERRLADYHRHAEEVRPRLRDGAVALQSEVNLHDAVPKGWRQAGGSIQFTVLVGDLQQGYETVVLEYRSGIVVGVTDEQLAGWFSLPDTEVWYDEVDVVDDSYEHRLLLHPAGELAIRFEGLTVQRSPASPSDR